MTNITPDPRWQSPGYLEEEVARMQERSAKRGLAGMPTLVLIVLLPFLLLAKAGQFLWKKARRR